MQTNSLILVIGGTGAVGQPVAKQLLRDGFRVRILTRNRDAAYKRLGDHFEYAIGDVEDDAGLRRALEGCVGVHLSLPSGHNPTQLERVQHQGTARVAYLAAGSGIQHLTYVSGYLVSEQFDYIPAERAKRRAEEAIRSSGVPYTIFRPTYFTDFLPRFVQGKRASVFGSQPHPIRFLALGDFARQIANAQRMPGTKRTLFTCGPEAITFEQALRLYAAQAAPEARVSHVPIWMMGMMNRLFLGGELTEILALMAATDRVGEIGDPSEANRLFGPPTTTVSAWVRQQV